LTVWSAGGYSAQPMTRRALIIGIFGAIVFAAGGRYINSLGTGPNIVRGHLPISVFGLLILFAMAINPVLGRIRASWRFSGGEMAFILALLLGVSTIIDAGLMRHFPKVCILGTYAEQTTPSMQKLGLVKYVPPYMIANDGKYSKEVVDDYVAPGDAIAWPGPWYKPWEWDTKEFGRTLKLSWDRVPWSAWQKPLLFWGAGLTLTYAAIVGLSVMVHRQWARRERIKYPLAEIISSLLVQDEQGRTAIFRNKAFWIGFGVSMFIAGGNIWRLFDPESIYIPTRFDFPMLNEAFPKFMQTTGAGYFASFKIYPAAIGIAFLLASDISFSLAIANPVTVFVLFILLQLGVDTSGGGALEGGVVPFQSFGAYLAYALMLLYIGRRYYWQTAKEAVTFVKFQETDTAAVWGLRIFVICSAGVVAMLVVGGMTWHIALLGIIVMMMIFFVLARMNAEAGTFFCQPSWTMSMVLFCVYGFGALGPRNYMGMTMVTYVLIAGTFECLMPYVANGLKVTTDTGLKAGRVGVLIAITVIAAMYVTISSGLWTDYQKTPSVSGSQDRMQMYQIAERQITRLDLAGELEASKRYTGWERLVKIKPDNRFLVWAAVGFVLTFALSAARLRWAWWPIHPIILLTFGSILMVGRYGASLILGWFIKAFVVKFAGPTRYASVKPLMMGVIAGDILGGFITMLVLWGYYLVTGVKGPGWQFW
jgi:hypothetical protein